MFQKSSGSGKEIWIRGRVSRFSFESFVSHSAGKKIRGTLLCSNEILVMTTCTHTKLASQFCQFLVRVWYKVFLSKTFDLTMPKKIVGKMFLFQKSSVMERTYR